MPGDYTQLYSTLHQPSDTAAPLDRKAGPAAHGPCVMLSRQLVQSINSSSSSSRDMGKNKKQVDLSSFCSTMAAAGQLKLGDEVFENSNLRGRSTQNRQRLTRAEQTGRNTIARLRHHFFCHRQTRPNR